MESVFVPNDLIEKLAPEFKEAFTKECLTMDWSIDDLKGQITQKEGCGDFLIKWFVNPQYSNTRYDSIYLMKADGVHAPAVVAAPVEEVKPPKKTKKVKKSKTGEFSLTCHKAMKEYDVTEKEEEQFLEITQKLVDAVKGNVNLVIPHGFHAHFPSKEDLEQKGFYVYMWGYPIMEGTPVKERNVPIPGTMWGVKPVCLDNAFPPSGKGIPIVTEEGFTVAELFLNKALFILYDAIHGVGGKEGETRQLEIYQHIIDEAATQQIFPTLSKEEQDKIIQAKIQKEFEKAKVGFIKLCKEGYTKRKSNYEASLKSLKQEIVSYQNQLITHIRECDDTVKALATLEAMESAAKVEEVCTNELKSIMKIPFIKGIKIMDKKFIVSTHLIKCENPRTKLFHDIGEFDITINLQEGNGEPPVKMINTLYKRDGMNKGMNAPHVFPDGKPCFGNISEAVPQLVARFEFSTLLALLIGYLQSVNLDDGAGTFISRWPISAGQPNAGKVSGKTNAQIIQDKERRQKGEKETEEIYVEATAQIPQ
jgi:hypothetical protein